MGAGKGGERKKGRESARKPGKTNAVRRKRGESHDFSAIALKKHPPGAPRAKPPSRADLERAVCVWDNPPSLRAPVAQADRASAF